MNDLRMMDIGGVRLACRVGGTDPAPPLVLLHSLGGSGADWAGLARRLGGAYQVYAPDLRGNGDSDRPGEYSFELMRDDVLGLLDALGLERVTLVGHSMGAAVAYLVASERPERIERLVLEEPPPPEPADRPRVMPEVQDPEAPFDWAMVAAIQRQRNDPDPAYGDRLTAITAPTLVIAGGESSFLPQDAIARLAGRIPDCRLVTIDAGHEVHEKRPEEFGAAIETFLLGPA
jgi:pimeloyl-ACP methyl ester carboxylesterase